jgi:SAM-dependent methyltransferase
MSAACNVCGARLREPIYESADNASITTMNKVIEGRTRVYFCNDCGHLQTPELPDLARYYALEYEINIASDEEDQLYKMVDGRAIYRAEHQADTLLRKLVLRPGQRVLDYGCAKAPTLRRVVDRVPGVIPMVFDVSDKYVAFWERFVAFGDWAVGEAPHAWQGSVDVVLSFYALEHVGDLKGALARVRTLLKPRGTFYFIVPNAYANIADFVVADHINHFSPSSLARMLAGAGFETVEVDDEAHDAAFVVTARRTEAASTQPSDERAIARLGERAREMGRFWTDAALRVRRFEAELPPTSHPAIYGAGFYGNFIAASLRRPERIECFVDQNRHLQGRMLHGKPVLAPTALPAGVDALLVGLNPRNAREIVERIDAWRGRDLRAFYF